MDIITIFQTLLRWGIPAFIGGVIFLSLFIVVYLVYKKVLHGKRDLTKVQLVSAILLFCWMLLVLGSLRGAGARILPAPSISIS